MKDVCFYCEKEKVVEEFENPNTHQTWLTCDRCKLELSLYIRQRKFFAKLFFLGIPLCIIVSIISFIFISWQIGVLLIALAICSGVISHFGLEYFLTKRDKELGRYVNRKKIQWCKTYKHLNKVKNYENVLWRSKVMIEDSEIPCKILHETRPIWTKYFDIETGERTLYPKNCERWERK